MSLMRTTLRKQHTNTLKQAQNELSDEYLLDHCFFCFGLVFSAVFFPFVDLRCPWRMLFGTNQSVYHRAARPLVDVMFAGGYATCFAFEPQFALHTTVAGGLRKQTA